MLTHDSIQILVSSSEFVRKTRALMLLVTLSMELLWDSVLYVCQSGDLTCQDH